MASKPKKSSSNGLEYRVRIYNDGIQRLDGDIISDSDGFVNLRYPRKGSSSFEQRLIPRSKIVAVTGTPGKRGTVIFHERVIAFEVRRGLLSVPKNSKLVDITWTNQRGESQSMSVDPSHAEIVALNGVEKPSAELSGKKKKASEKKSKKK